MQFTYQFPEMVERLVLVSSGGLGPDVSPILRAAALPGADLFISSHAPGIARRAGSALGRGLGGGRPQARRRPGRGRARLRVPRRSRAPQGLPGDAALGRRHRRPARRPALDRLYLAEALPLLIVWGDRDPIISVAHGEAAHAPLPEQPPGDFRWRRPRAPTGGAGPFRRHPPALPRGDRAGSTLTARSGGAVQERLGKHAPGRIRTCGLRLRRAALYPAELRALTKELSQSLPHKAPSNVCSVRAQT